MSRLLKPSQHMHPHIYYLKNSGDAVVISPPGAPKNDTISLVRLNFIKY